MCVWAGSASRRAFPSSSFPPSPTTHLAHFLVVGKSSKLPPTAKRTGLGGTATSSAPNTCKGRAEMTESWDRPQGTRTSVCCLVPYLCSCFWPGAGAGAAALVCPTSRWCATSRTDTCYKSCVWFYMILVPVSNLTMQSFIRYGEKNGWLVSCTPRYSPVSFPRLSVPSTIDMAPPAPTCSRRSLASG